MVDFWRVEDRVTGEGPYTFWTWGLWDTDKRTEPTPIIDGLSPYAHRVRDIFGFESPEQLTNWMGPEIIPALERNLPGKYVIRHYSAKKYSQVGGHQVTANSEKLRELQTFELNEFCSIYDNNILTVKEGNYA